MKVKIKTAATLQDAVLDMMDSASKTAVRKLIKNHRVTVDGDIQPRPDFAVLPGQTIEIAQKAKDKENKKDSEREENGQVQTSVGPLDPGFTPIT